MVNREEARHLVSAWLNDQSARSRIALELLEEETIELEFGWTFFYTSKEFKETGDFRYALAGNAPVVVDRAIGSLHTTGTAQPIAKYIEEFRRRRAMVGLATASFVGEQPLDNAILARLPRDYTDFLQSINGCVVFGGGLHIRGASANPDWHSLRQVWIGEDRLSRLFPGVKADDIPFAQDCFGDQFLLRSGSVMRLHGETGEVEDLAIGWREFLTAAAANPNEYLSLQLLEHFRSEGRCLEPGQLLSVYPPLCTAESANGVSLKPIPALERIRFLADFAAQISGLSNGSKIRMIVE
jgi:Immunity protein 35/SMI1 / KNR4 family (SUKH-1)